MFILRQIGAEQDRYLIKADTFENAGDSGEYEGSYDSSELNVTYTLTEKEHLLYINAVKNYKGNELRMIAPDIFFGITGGIRLRFQREDGCVASFYLDGARSQNFEFRKKNINHE